MSISQILRGIYGNRYWLIIGMIIACACAILWNKSDPPLYSSSIEIFVDEPYVAPDILANMSHRPSQGAKRAFHEAGSSAILEHLTQKFDLFGHYRISRERSYSKQLIQQKLKRRMSVRLIDQNTLKITIKDANKDIAAMMASEIFSELKKRNEARLALDVQNTHKLYQSVLKDIEKNITKSEKMMQKLLGSISGRSDSDGPSDAGGDILTLIEKIDRSNKEYAQVSRTDQLVTALARKEHLPRMILVQNATIDLDNHPMIISITRVAGVALASLLIMVSGLVYYYRNKKELYRSIDELFPGLLKNHRASSSNEDVPDQLVRKPEEVMSEA